MTKTIALLSNVTTELLAQTLPFEVYQPQGYDTWFPEILDLTSVFNTSSFDAVIVILHCKDAKKNWQGNEQLNEWLAALESAAERKPGTRFFIANLDIAVDVIRPACESQPERIWEYHWQAGIHLLQQRYDNVFLLDIKGLVEEYGRSAFYSPKMWYAAAMPYSLKGLKAIAAEIMALLAPAQKKVLITDLDNTLWGGVAGEDEIVLSEYKEGARFRDFQLRLKELSATGALLAIVSKNNEDTANAIITEHPHMALAADDFAVKMINWKSKAENISTLAEELNLGLDSMVFIDDNPLERELIKQELPDVVVLDFPEDTSLLEKTALEAYGKYFKTLRSTAEDRARTRIYRQESKRKALSRTAETPLDYIKALNIKADIRQMQTHEISRVVQLCNKTNQFNLTTKRYSKREILALTKECNCKLLNIHCRDKFGDSGLVGVIILKEYGKRVEIDSFLLSCRVMGRYLEDYAFTSIAEFYKTIGFERIDAVFIPTLKNFPVKHFYDRLGFEVTAHSEELTEYSFDLSKPVAMKKIYTFTAQIGG